MNTILTSQVMLDGGAGSSWSKEEFRRKYVFSKEQFARMGPPTLEVRIIRMD